MSLQQDTNLFIHSYLAGIRGIRNIYIIHIYIIFTRNLMFIDKSENGKLHFKLYN